MAASDGRGANAKDMASAAAAAAGAAGLFFIHLAKTGVGLVYFLCFESSFGADVSTSASIESSSFSHLRVVWVREE
jgi:hypothetical protein